MALHFLPHEFKLTDAKSPGREHQIELFEHGGKQYLRVWIGGTVGPDELLCEFTPNQAAQFAEGAERLSSRLSGQ